MLALVDPLADDVVVAGELDGRTFAGERLAGGEGAGAADEVSFADGRIASRADAARGFAPAIYAASVAGTTITFAAAAAGPDGATIEWKGTVDGGAIDATTVDSRPGGSAVRGRFRGRVRP